MGNVDEYAGSENGKLGQKPCFDIGGMEEIDLDALSEPVTRQQLSK